FEASVVVLLLEFDLREATPGGQKVRRLLGHLGQETLGLVWFLGGEIEIDKPQPRRRADRREVGRGLELALGFGTVALDEVERAEEGMRLDRLRLPRDGLLEGTFRPPRILLPEVEGAERQVRLGPIAHRGERLLDPFDGRIYFLGGGRGVG